VMDFEDGGLPDGERRGGGHVGAELCREAFEGGESERTEEKVAAGEHRGL
jgi:hypothetical protein